MLINISTQSLINVEQDWRSSETRRNVESLTHAVRQTPLFGNGIAMTHPRMDNLRRALRIPRPHTRAPVYDSEMASVYSELGFAGFAAWYTLRITLLILSIRSARDATADDFTTLRRVFVLAQIFSLFVPFVWNATAGLLVTAAAGLSLRKGEPWAEPPAKRFISATGSANEHSSKRRSRFNMRHEPPPA
jgi:hypothetical protein